MAKNKKMTERVDDRLDRKAKIKDGSKKDIALDFKRGLAPDKKIAPKKAKKK